MRPNLFHGIGKLLSLLAIMLLIGLFITFSITSFPVSQDNPGAYRGVEVTKAVPSAPPGGINSSVFVSRPAGTGTLLEAGYSPFNSTYRIINQWYGDLDGLQMYVFAGGRRSEPASGNDGVEEPAWPGIVVLVVNDAQGNHLIEKGGQFRPPQEAGPVRIVAVKDTQLILVAQDGTAFAFDVMRRQFVAEKLASPISRSMGAGMLVESGNVPYNLAGFEFVNYWYHENKDLSRMVVMAGGESNNPQRGTLVIAVSSPSTDSEPIQALAFNTSMSDGYLRIVDGDGEKLILVSAEDLVYEFNLASLEFTSLPSGSSAISGMPIKVGPPSSEPGIMFASPTPEATLTPRPTRTPLPTYNPYP